MDNLIQAHNKASKDKAHYRDVIKVNKDPEYHLGLLQDILINKRYEVSLYVIKDICDNGKARRLMKLPYFPDRIVQWAIMLQIESTLVNTFTSFTFASVKNRGIHKASILLNRYLRDKEHITYCLKMDIRKFYPSVNHGILKELLTHKFKDPDLLNILFTIVDSMPGDTGIPIGSYLSQYFANFYLAYFDHWLKEELKIKYVVRYMDDIVVLHESKEYLHTMKKQVEHYLKHNLLLTIKDNWQVFPVGIRGIDFVGYRHFFGYKLLRKSIYKRFRSKAQHILKRHKKYKSVSKKDFWSINSHIGWLMWCDGYNLLKNYIKPVYNEMNNFYNKKKQRRKFHERFRNYKRRGRSSSTYSNR